MTTPVLTDEPDLTAAVMRAKGGDRGALEHVVAAVQDDVFRLALRMTADAQDAQDASQEILIKVITRLDGFRGEASVRTWAYRIAIRHMLDRKKSRVEALALDFRRFGDDLLDGLAADPDPDPLLANEVKLGCTLAMLTCLDREHRLAYILGDVFDLSHESAAELCDLTEEAQRQRLSRARRAVEAFTTSFCGLVSADAPCLCSKRVARAEELGRVARDAERPRDQLQVAVTEMEMLHTTAQIMRAHPAYAAPTALLDGVRRAIGSGLRVLE